MRVAWFPKAEELAGNPYWPLLQSHLEQIGAQFETSHNGAWLARRWLIEHRKSVQVLHFHFIQSHYAAKTTAKSMRRLAKFASDLLLARSLGYRVVWTVHDLMPTWPLQPAWLDSLGRRIIASLATDVIVHCEQARSLVASRFGRRHDVHTIRHAGFLPLDLPKREARARAGLPPDGLLLAFVGGIRPNKGIEFLLEAFEPLATVDVQLVIAGKAWKPSAYVEEIRARAAKIPNVSLRDQDMNHDELSVYARAADLIILPFREILTSSSVMLAQSCGCPVIVPEVGCMREMVGPGAGFFYPRDDVTGLRHALVEALKADLKTMGRCAQESALKYSWRAMAAATLDVYEGR